MKKTKDEDKKTRRYLCDTCGAVEFEVTVEPMYPLNGDRAQWLRDCQYCPQCGSIVEEQE